MSLKVALNDDIKTAMLSGDKPKVEVLKSLKSAILYEEVAQKVRESGLSDEQVLVVFARESKKRAESADLYKKAGDSDRAATELSEKAIIDAYLPEQLSDQELEAIVDEAIASSEGTPQIGQIIGAVRAKVGQKADGAKIAALVKSKLG